MLENTEKHRQSDRIEQIMDKIYLWSDKLLKDIDLEQIKPATRLDFGIKLFSLYYRYLSLYLASENSVKLLDESRARESKLLAAILCGEIPLREGNPGPPDLERYDLEGESDRDRAESPGTPWTNLGGISETSSDFGM